MEKINLQAIETHKVASYIDNQIALVSRMSDIRTIPREKMLLEGYIFALIVKGNASAVIDDISYELGEGDVFIFYPRNILESFMMSIDLEVRAAFVAPELAERLADIVNLNWTFRLMAQSHEIIHSSPENIRHFIAYFDLLQDKLAEPDSPNKANSLRMLFASLIYEIIDVGSRKNIEVPEADFSSSENLMQRFFQLLSETENPYMTVSEYADRLNISPKYFSSVCKRTMGKTAGQLIDDAVIKMAQVLLHDRYKSIKQIADQLNFENQSHFGTYFKRHVGISPQEYRNNLGNRVN